MEFVFTKSDDNGHFRAPCLSLHVFYVAILAIMCACVLAVSANVRVAWAVDNAGGEGVLSNGGDLRTTTLSAQADDAWSGNADTSWYNADGTSFVLSTPDQLAGLAAIVNGTASGIAADDFTGKTVTLAGDMKLNATSADEPVDDKSQRNWVPIGGAVQTGTNAGGFPVYSFKRFNGTFNGNGHTVFNIYKYTPTEEFGGYSGLFGLLGPKAVVVRVALEGGFVYGRVAGSIAAASLVGKADIIAGGPLIERCYSNASVRGNGSTVRGVGGIFGGCDEYSESNDAYQGAARIVNCHFAGKVEGLSANPPTGGIAGIGSLKVSDCLNTGDVSGAAGNNHIGKLVGCLLMRGYQNESHPSGVHDRYDGSLAHSNSTGSGTLYYAFQALGDEDGSRCAATAVSNSESVFFLSGYPWADLADSEGGYSLGSAFAIVDEASSGESYHEYRLKLAWMAGVEQAEADFTISGGVDEVVAFTKGSTLPKPVVKAKAGGTTLQEGHDYVVAYRDSDGAFIGTPMASGTYEVVVTGMGAYAGQASKAFSVVVVPYVEPDSKPVPAPVVNPVVVDLSKAKVVVADQVCTGRALKPAVKVTLGGKTLKAGTDYTAMFKSTKKVGTASVTVTGKGAYAGTAAGSFKVVPAAPMAKKASGGEASLALSWKTSAKAGGYQVMVATNSKFTKGKKTAKVSGAKKASGTVKKLKASKKYWAKVRAYKTVGGKTYYSAWSKAKTAKTAKTTKRI